MNELTKSLDELLVDYRQMVSSRVLMKTYMDRASIIEISVTPDQEPTTLKNFWLSLEGQECTNNKVLNLIAFAQFADYFGSSLHKVSTNPKIFCRCIKILCS